MDPQESYYVYWTDIRIDQHISTLRYVFLVPECLFKHELTNVDQVISEGYKPITTQIFDKDSDYLDNDSVFAVKTDLVVEFVRRQNDDNAKLELKYDVLMVPQEVSRTQGSRL